MVFFFLADAIRMDDTADNKRQTEQMDEQRGELLKFYECSQ